MQDRREVAVLFDGSIEGFLCILYAYYYEGISPLIIQVDGHHQPTLDTEEYFVAADHERAERVQKAIRGKISYSAEHTMAYAFLAEDDDRFMVMFRYLVLGFKVGAALDNHMQEDCVLRVRKLARQVGRETHLLKSFCRFEETEGQTYYCPITPSNYVLPLLAEHFSDRMMNQAWAIHDKRRNKAALYNGETYVIADVPENVNVQHTNNEAHVQALWKTFFNSVNIKERVNPKVQRNLLPLYFRKNMTEFQIK